MRSITPLLERRPPVSPVASPRRLLQQNDAAPEMLLWDQRANHLMMEAEDKILLYHGVKVPPSELTAIRTTAGELLDQLRDCYPHCSQERQQDMAATRRAITEVMAQLTEASHDIELEVSIRGSVSSGPSGRSTPLDRYLQAINNLEDPQQAHGDARPRDASSGRASQRAHMRPPPATAPPNTGRPAMGPLPGTGHGCPPGGRDNSSNRARDNSGDNGHR